MPAAALPPPTSPYLQALERASGIIKQQQQASASRYGYEDESDGCWVCGNATRASQAYCSTACRDEDNLQRSLTDLRATTGAAGGHRPQQEILNNNDDLILYTEQLQLSSPTLSPAVHAVPALVPSASSRKNRSGTTTPVAHASSSAAVSGRRSSSNRAQMGENHHQGSSNRHGSHAATTNSSAGEGSSSSPPSSSATSSPTKTATTDDDRIEEDIENLLLPPPIGTGLDKKAVANNAFDYAYPYGIRAGTAVVIPKSPTSTKTQPHRTTNQANPIIPVTSSTGMRKSTSQQNNRHSKQQTNMMLSPIFAPKSVGATTSSGLLQENKSRSNSRPNTGSSSNTTHDNSNTPPVDPSEVITFRRRHHAPDSINGLQKSSHGGSGNVSTAASSSSASPALQGLNHGSTSATSSKSASRRHSSHGSQITSPKMVPAFSPLVKARSTTSKTIPTLKDLESSNTAQSSSNTTTTTTTSTSSPLIKPVDGQGITASPSLAASSLSDLLLRTTSRSEGTSPAPTSHQHQQSVAVNKRASKSDIVLGNSLGGYAPSSNSGTKEASTSNNRASWLQRNKLTKNFFSFNGPSSTLSRIGAAATAEGQGVSSITSHTTCGRKNCPVNHHLQQQTSSTHHHHQHPLASFFTPLSRRVTEPGGGSNSPFASPAIYYADYPKDPFEESFISSSTSRSVSDSITTLKKNNLSPISPSSAFYGSTIGASSGAAVSGNDGVRRRPSLSTSATSPAVITTPSPGPGGMKPQDYSGFAGFLFALHNQRKANAAASSQQQQQQAESATDSSKRQDTSNGKRASFEIYDTPESSESGYDAQDEQVSAVRGRGRTSGRRAIAEKVSTTGTTGTLFKSEEQAHVAKPALLKEKLANVVRASNDRPSSSISSSDSVEATNTAAVSPARSTASGQNARPTRFLFGRGNAFKNSNLNDTTPAESTKAGQEQTTAKKNVAPPPRLRHNHSTSVGEGSQYIVSLRGQSDKGSKLENHNDDDDDSPSEDLLLNDDRNSPSPPPDRAVPANEARGRPTARRRSSANGRLPLVSPFTTLDRESRQNPKEQINEEGGRGRSRARGSAALHRSVSPARSSSRARGRDSPRLRMR